ncbi:MAG: hypothetical protein JOZ27_01050 [Caulobacteraceae bacterium]|nr:hypothetical protein [Caulobacteraceae bacterium]
MRVPASLADSIGLVSGEAVIMEARGDELVIRKLRDEADRQARADAATEAIRRRSQDHTLGGIRIRDLIDDGRKY